MQSTVKIHLKKAVQNMIHHDLEGWPPDSMGCYYQPRRPEKIVLDEGTRDPKNSSEA